MIFSENRHPPSEQVRGQAFSGSCSKRGVYPFLRQDEVTRAAQLYRSQNLGPKHLTDTLWLNWLQPSTAAGVCSVRCVQKAVRDKIRSNVHPKRTFVARMECPLRAGTLRLKSAMSALPRKRPSRCDVMSDALGHFLPHAPAAKAASHFAVGPGCRSEGEVEQPRHPSNRALFVE